MSNIKISIIIPTYNSSRTIRLCLEGIMNQHEKPDEVIVVDDCSKDSTLEIINDFDVKLIRNLSNRGPSYSRNKGAQVASGDILFFVDSDILIPEDATMKIKEIFDKMPDISCLCGIYSVIPLIEKRFISSYRIIQSHYWKKSGCGFVTRFSVSVGAIKKEAFDAVGGFNEEFSKADVEDYEIGHKLIEKGYKIYQTDKIQAKHDGIYLFRDLISTLFRRSFLYFSLLLRRKKPDTGYLNKMRILTYPVALCSVALFLFAFMNIIYLWFWFLSVLIIMILDIGLYNAFRKEKGIFFMLRCIPLHYFVISVMAFGFISGAVNSLLKNVCR
jgi:glycosyltransferase involved in cell wall biosynthesis